MGNPRGIVDYEGPENFIEQGKAMSQRPWLTSFLVIGLYLTSMGLAHGQSTQPKTPVKTPPKTTPPAKSPPKSLPFPATSPSTTPVVPTQPVTPTQPQNTPTQNPVVGPTTNAFTNPNVSLNYTPSFNKGVASMPGFVPYNPFASSNPWSNTGFYPNAPFSSIGLGDSSSYWGRQQNQSLSTNPYAQNPYAYNPYANLTPYSNPYAFPMNTAYYSPNSNPYAYSYPAMQNFNPYMTQPVYYPTNNIGQDWQLQVGGVNAWGSTVQAPNIFTGTQTINTTGVGGKFGPVSGIFSSTTFGSNPANSYTFGGNSPLFNPAAPIAAPVPNPAVLMDP